MYAVHVPYRELACSHEHVQMKAYQELIFFTDILIQLLDGLM